MAIGGEKQRRIPAATILTVMVAFLSGGFAGAVFTWYVNRPQPTVLTYAITTTSLGTSEVSSVVPNLKLQIGTENIDSLYTHAIELTVAKGPFVDQANFAISLPADSRVFGMRADAPSALQSISCSAVAAGSRCQLGPLSSKVSRPFRVTIATNKRDWPSVDMVAKNVELIGAAQYLKENQEPILPDWAKIVFALCAYVAVLIFIGVRKKSRTKSKADQVQDEKEATNQGATKPILNS